MFISVSPGFWHSGNATTLARLPGKGSFGHDSRIRNRKRGKILGRGFPAFLRDIPGFGLFSEKNAGSLLLYRAALLVLGTRRAFRIPI